MKIAQIAPLYERVPPLLYGGTERIVAYLTEELVRQGHQVTLFASGDSQTGAALVPCSKAALRLNPLIRDPLPYHLMQMEEVGRRAAEFDVLHFHTDLVHFPLLLCRDAETERVFVRHEPNAPSGGRVSDLDIGTFLSRGPLNPEHQALLRLIATLVHNRNDSSPPN